ncbi:GNAT family N-acetyltransferase [Gelidibacter salicanalis]|uniref:GNAT family N-acetyltransferase n=1 Tax=Gelidibacter salicanalis TaxID=291193 RepID=A0A934NHG8_9FLAO|nr:GNAT family N-acetyltransferase [Gelidibacter salicanalis]MBJ7879733.1 GNAT family N-acetyltransferase [Gelidibacter salicanalis]
MIYSSDTISISVLQPDDALQLNKLLVSNTERFIRFLPLTLADNRTLESTRNYIKRKIEAAEMKEGFVFVIKDKYQVQIIGLIILKQIQWDIKQGEFAYCIGKHHKGKGLITEAIKAVSTHVSEVMGLKTLQIISHKTNESSVNVALNSGFKWKQTLVNEFTPVNEAPMDMELFELKT